MKNLYKVSSVVKAVLTDIPQTRNSDHYLYLKVLERIAELKGSPAPTNLAIGHFLVYTKKLGYPYFETVRRARQKVQEKHPELQADEEIREVRDAKEEVFHYYAIGEAVE